MSVNGTREHTLSPTDSPSSTPSHLEQHVSELRLSLDSEESSSASSVLNGPVSALNGKKHNLKDGLSTVERLELELEQTRQEKESLATQYSNLLGRLTTMRTTLGNKLKQDAEELDRREQLVNQLTTQNEDLNTTVEMLKGELIVSHEEADRAAKTLDAIRSRALEDNAHESLMRERELREAQSEIERLRIERDEWEQAATRERIESDDAKALAETLKRDLEVERAARELEAEELELERGKSNNLQTVLEDFQAAKDHELRQAVQDHETQLHQATQLLAEFKSRALTAEAKLDETQTHSSRTHELEKEVKEKSLLIGKLRHEAVIINEHLIEALRRLRRNASDNLVDRALVTNVLLNFLSRPREDPKRFEMLTVLANVLSWADTEREKAGLQRSNASGVMPGASSFWGRPLPSSGAKSAELAKTDETESFSRLWVEFLLTEAASGEPVSPASPSSRPNTSLPGSPTRQSFSLNGPPKRGSSLANTAMASSPNLMLTPSPSRKGKEREIDT